MTQKNAMVGQAKSWCQKFREGWLIYREHAGCAWGGAATYKHRFIDLKSLYTRFTGKEKPDRILEVGCGQRAVMPILFGLHGIEAFGIDVEVPTNKIDLSTIARIVRLNGVERALKSVMRHVLFDKRFFRELATTFGVDSLSSPHVHIRVKDCAEMDFPDNHFDFLFSFAVLEHVQNPAQAIRQINRVLHRDGIGKVSVHLFPSLSGGHCMAWQQVATNASRKVAPWDHLLDNQYPSNVFLNKLSLKEYDILFSNYTDVLERSVTREGETFLSVAPRSLLQKYTEEDLITSGVTYIFRKKEL